tara:strand:+ start:145 stop:1509 length:1365 start_codon:yes stop_codon:yes gene_type:complete
MASSAPTPTSSAPTTFLDALEVDVMPSSMISELTCALCLGVFDDPRLGCNRGHHFCGPCLKKWHTSGERRSNSCPTCRSPLLVPRPGEVGEQAAVVAQCVASQRVRCPRGCGDVLLLGEARKHVGVCCPNDVIACPFAPYCSQTGKRCDLEQHLKDNLEVHMRIAFDATENLKKVVMELRTSEKTNTEKIAGLERSNARLSKDLSDASAYTHQLLVSLHEKNDRSEGVEPASGGRSQQPKRRRSDEEMGPPPVRRVGFEDSFPSLHSRRPHVAMRETLPAGTIVRIAGPDDEQFNGRVGTITGSWTVRGASSTIAQEVKLDNRGGLAQNRYFDRNHLVESSHHFLPGQTVSMQRPYDDRDDDRNGTLARVVAVHGGDVIEVQQLLDDVVVNIRGSRLVPALRSALSAYPVYLTEEEESLMRLGPPSPGYSPTSPGYSPTSPGHLTSPPPSPRRD